MIKLWVFIYVMWVTSVVAVVHVDSFNTNLPLGLTHSLSFNVDFLKGNNDYVSFQPDYRGNYRFSYDALTQLFFIGNLQYSYKHDVTIRDQSFYHFRFLQYLSDRFRYDVFLQYQANVFTLLKRRILFGFSFGKQLFDLSWLKHTSNLGLMLEHERLSTGVSMQLLRITHFQRFHFPITSFLNHYSIIYYQPYIMQFSDYRVLFENQFVVRLSDRFHYSLSLDYHYDSKSLASLAPYDIALKQFFSISL